MNRRREVPSSPPSRIATPEPSADGRASTAAALSHGVLRGLVPLLCLLLAAGATLTLTALAGQLTPGLDFFARRSLSVGITSVGLVSTAVLYAATCIVSLRRVARWQERGDLWVAVGALLALSVTALIVALPLILAVLLPQHPAP